MVLMKKYHKVLCVRLARVVMGAMGAAMADDGKRVMALRRKDAKS
jgi:hypothetical protein